MVLDLQCETRQNRCTKGTYQASSRRDGEKNTYLQSIYPVRTTIGPLPCGDPGLDSTIRLFNEALGTRSPRATINDFDTVSSHELQANSFELPTIIRLEDLKDTEHRYPMVDIVSNRRSFLILHSKEHMELAEVVFHMTDPFVFAVRSGRHINEIDLHPLKETRDNNGFERSFRLTMGLAMTDLTQLDKEIDLLGRDTIVLIVDLGGSSILTGMA